jgi:energy-coupling factor transport system ATP-binding protein
MPSMIVVDRISFRYPSEDGGQRSALADISFVVGEGEFIAILGANGSGKTTLARHLNGLLKPSSGRVMVDGLDTRERSNLGHIRQQVGMVFQHPEEQIIATTVEEDIAFGPENLGLEPALIRRRVDEAIEAVGLHAHRQRPPHLLSAGQMQRLALAGVLAMRPRCVVFDEATTMLDPAGRRMALQLMAGLRQEGLSVIFVTHNMEEAALAGRILVLHHGNLVFDGTPANAFSASRVEEWGLELPPAVGLARRIAGCVDISEPYPLTMDDFLQALPHWNGGLRKGGAEMPEVVTGLCPVIETSALEHVYMKGTPLSFPALLSVDMKVWESRAHGLAGVTGSGKSTLLQHLNGLLRPQKGSVQVGEMRLEDPAVLTKDVVKSVGLVFQNPEMQFFETYVGDEIAYGPRQLGLEGSIKAHVRWAMEQVGLDFEEFKDRPVYALSGGERRKVALASVLAGRPKFLLLDEPTAGLDPRSHREILIRLQNMQKNGTQIVVSSHRMDDLAELALDITVFRKGHNLYSGPAAAFFTQQEELLEAGLEAPTAARTAGRLRELGWPVPVSVVTAGQLGQALGACQEQNDEPV